MRHLDDEQAVELVRFAELLEQWDVIPGNRPEIEADIVGTARDLIM